MTKSGRRPLSKFPRFERLSRAQYRYAVAIFPHLYLRFFRWGTKRLVVLEITAVKAPAKVRRNAPNTEIRDTGIMPP